MMNEKECLNKLFCRRIFEFHKAYFVTVKDILNHLPNYFVSSLNQFISITVDEWLFLEKMVTFFRGADQIISECPRWFPRPQ